MFVTLIVVAALWGAATGLLVPRAAYRLSVEPDQPWRDSCGAGHPLTGGPARGWLAGPTCRPCRHGRSSRSRSCSQSRQSSRPRPRSQPRRSRQSRQTRQTRQPRWSGPADGTTTEIRPPESAPLVTAVQPSPLARESEPHPRPTSRPRPFGPLLAPPLLAPLLLTALSCAALAAATGPRPELAVWLLCAPFAVLLATVDVRVHRLPDPLTLPLAAGVPLLLLGAELLPYDAGSWPHALLGGLALGGGYFVLFLIRPSGMGFGDVKLALSVGAALGWYGWGVLFVGTFLGFVLGALYGLGLVLARRGSRKSAIPFGPFMIGGALLGLLLGALSASA
ncbi:prepilin peptidase [Streptomyces sp. NPDC090127]|uniref:prepilin peptidase n=1 Tax=Streptomyces sp. NPDC090127 TaxID=3365953 RepID=UPI0037FA4262